ncbi:MAG: hypothetical protein COB02_09700 [Candidatus Cloacimonadota bacterium]|nr:MAG: hypothetical protein COB02_09700 [Candidatus Cloacimonadota bacterium]
MHPIIKGFIDSIEIDAKSHGLLKSIEEIRGKTPVSIYFAEKPNINDGFLGALDMILGDFIYNDRIELLLFQFSASESTEFEVAKYLKANVGDYDLVLDAKLDKGSYLISGAKELIFGRLASIKKHFASVKIDAKEIRTEHLKILSDEGKDPLDHLDKKQVLILKGKEQEIQEKLKYLTDDENHNRILELSKFLCGCDVSLNRYDLKKIGFDVLSMESLGFLASYSQLSGLYQSLASIQTMIEGVKQEESPNSIPQSNVEYRAKAQVLAILETPKKRLICFQITEENPSRNSEIFWIEK